MVRFRKKRKRAVTRPIRQDIPKHIKKGDPVLYMLQRIGQKQAKLITCLVISNPRRFEKKLHSLFSSDRFTMTRKTRPPGVLSRHQVKFGISSNLPERIEDINDDLFGGGKTEWFKISWPSYLIAMSYFWYLRHSVWIWLFATVCFVGFWLITFNQ